MPSSCYQACPWMVSCEGSPALSRAEDGLHHLDELSCHEGEVEVVLESGIHGL